MNNKSAVTLTSVLGVLPVAPSIPDDEPHTRTTSYTKQGECSISRKNCLDIVLERKSLQYGQHSPPDEKQITFAMNMYACMVYSLIANKSSIDIYFKS